MNDTHKTGHHGILQRIAQNAMIEKGLLPDFSAAELAELSTITEPAHTQNGNITDLRKQLWCSIDNHDSQDLDQLSFAEAKPDGSVKIFVAVADVDALLKQNSALDKHAKHNTSTVYTAARIFPMIPEKLSTDFTSLSVHEDRFAIVVELLIATTGSVKSFSIYRAWVRNQAKLSYQSLADWLDGKAPMPAPIATVKGLEANLRLQDKVAQKMKVLRHEHGALEFETIHASPIFESGELKDLRQDRSNRAKDIVADFMIAANGAVALFLSSKNFPSLRRVVSTPKRWDRIMELAAEKGFKLQQEPDAKALNQFLMKEKAADPLRFPDLSLSVIKLLGGGEYAIELPGHSAEGHFGLAVKDYTHSTAPNRRFPDLITQRLVKAAINGKPVPYTNQELEALAKHCSVTEDAVKKVERHVDKSAAALLLHSRIGEVFDSIVTGASAKGTWVRLLHLPVEGRLVSGSEGLDVGHRLRVKLLSTDVERGFIDLKRLD